MEINKVLDMNCSGRELEIKELLKNAVVNNDPKFRISVDDVTLINPLENIAKFHSQFTKLDF